MRVHPTSAIDCVALDGLMESLKRARSRRGRLGCWLHPEAITEGWYAADCPPEWNAKAAGIGVIVRLRWALACWLRGAGTKKPVGADV